MPRLTAATALSTTLMLLAQPAWAQANQAPAGDNGAGIGEIVVTAQKRAENIQNVPIAISAVSSQFLQSRAISSIDSLGSIAPNLVVERAPSDKTATQIAIRGSVTINPAVTWEPAVGLYLNGVYVAKGQGSIFDIADLERVEVLRGPQGTLYGRNALAGAINLVPKAPSGKASVRAEASYGNYNSWKALAVVDLPAMGDFALKVSGQIQKHDGYVKIGPNPYPAAFLAQPNSVTSTNDLDSKSAMVQLRYHPAGSALTADYMFDYSNFDQKPDYAQLYRVNRNGDPRDIFDPASPGYAFGGAFFPLNLYTNTQRQSSGSIDGNPLYEKSRIWGHALTLALDLGAVTVKSITSYRDMHWADSLDLDGSPLPVALTKRDTSFYSFSQELQATGKAAEDKLSYVAGLFYYKEKAETLGPQDFFFGGASYQSDYGSHTRAFAAYAQLDYNLTDQFKVSLGGRYTHETKDVRRYLRVNKDTANGITSPLVVANIPYGGVPDANYNSFTPAVTLAWQAQSNINLYARFAQGFKSGGFNGETNIFVAPTAACPSGATELCQPYRPEKVDSYEVGIKTRWADGKLIFNLAGFWDEHKDIQLSVFTASGAASSVVRNAAKARIRGVEAEMVAKLGALTLNGSLAFLDPKYESYLDGGVDVASNRAFPHAPKATMALGADFLAGQGSWGKLDLIADVNHVASYYTFPYALVTPTPSDQNANNTRSPGRTIVNLRTTLSKVPLGGAQGELSLWMKNVTGEDRPQNFIDFGPGFGGLTVAYFPDPRTYGITLGVKF
ncbi:MAG: TonB-dependent receptor [Proteobacteria bacterium]|nr:TonB-dependent receptor [Pseudomonadota bacterium]